VAIYSVYRRAGEAPVLVADRFSWVAAIVPPFYALVHRAWLLLLFWAVAAAALAWLSLFIGEDAAGWIYVVLAVWIGWEASGFRRRSLARRGFHLLGERIARTEEEGLVGLLAASR
jgi:hypothetical protein